MKAVKSYRCFFCRKHYPEPFTDEQGGNPICKHCRDDIERVNKKCMSKIGMNPDENVSFSYDGENWFSKDGKELGL